ncbi:ubiquitin-like-conjugating enzyme ATG3 [Hyalella azteca]|uniref:Ubiquitin-like-conjugating enzyme ATG3 n=1 Tax=Hyalella azteca TaxID=294128 RepID=A0A8B7PMC0_HYAAZ|nr:ubiquitin-like-conjugating enzyme ATG3 [Hyalella azteca]
MQNILNAVKGKALGVAEYLTPVLTESKFLETGVLTPEEFVAAGDHLTHHCPTWQWDAGDPAYTRPYLPPDKQFLVTRNVPCYKRVKQMEYQGAETVLDENDGDGGWVDTHSSSLLGDNGSGAVAQQIAEMTLDDDKEEASRSVPAPLLERQEEPEDDEDEAFDMDEFDEMGKVQDEDPSEYIAPVVSGKSGLDDVMEGAAGGGGEIVPTRRYDLHITYDKYYQTPRLWLTGYDENRVPLSVEAMYEDFSEDHANKTITVETHPHLSGGPPMASVHPCKHAETMKKLCEIMTSRGSRELQVHLYLIVFLKFMQAIIPTLEYDFTQNFTL